MIVKEKKSGRLSLALTIAAITALLIGVGIQVGLGLWRYRQSCESAGALLGEAVSIGMVLVTLGAVLCVAGARRFAS